LARQTTAAWQEPNKLFATVEGGIMTETYEFFPDHIKVQLPPLYSQEKNKDPIVYVKFFCPWNQWTWYITEGQAEDEDFLFFGYVVGHAREWGYFVLSDFESITGPGRLKIERDMYFSAQNASQIADIHSHYKPKDYGVQKQYRGCCDQETVHESCNCLVCGNQQATLNTGKEPEITSSTKDPDNLTFKRCRVCTEHYDTPHKPDCSQRRNPFTPFGEPRVLVKMEDL
jgi:hypothetical protein